MPSQESRSPEAQRNEAESRKRKERIADRAEHEEALGRIHEHLSNPLDWEHAEIVFPDAPAIERLLKKEKWLPGAGRYVARADVQYNPGPKTDGKDNSDRFYEALVAAGYKVDVWPDFKNDNALEYYIYEALAE